MESTDPLLQPFKLRHLSLRNRVLSTSHEPAYSEDGLPKLRYQLYHEEKAKGGIALTMFGGSTLVARDSPPAFGNLYAGDDLIVPYFAQLAERVHRHGAALMCQLTHLGRRTSPYTGDWLPVVWPSCVREPAHRSFPKIIEESDMRRIAQAYGAAALRCRQGGLDGIELEAYGHLLDSFWSPAWNKRSDEYGTRSIDDRIRFALRVLDAIRARVGADFIVGIRMVIDEDLDGGLRREDGMEIARRLIAAGDLAFVNVIRGHIETDEALSHVIPNMGTPAAPFLDFAGEVRRELGVPVFHAARINEVATARHAIREGLLDMVGMTRAHMADPHIVAKIARGEEDRIRACVGAGYCIDRIYEGGEALCIQNPATGREATMPHEIPRALGGARKVVVIGAGPAGLEAARVCALRGHRVVVMEAAAQAGGQVPLAARVTRRRELLGITEWLRAEAERAGAVLRFGCYAEIDEVLAESPEVVIVATGGTPNTEFLALGGDLVTTTWDLLSGQVSPAAEVLLYDDNGQHQGLVCAEFLAERGVSLELVTPDRAIGADIGGTNYPAYYRALYAHGVRMSVNLRLRSVVRDGNQLVASFVNEYDKTECERRAEQVVVEHGTLPADELYFALRGASSNRGEIDIEALIAGRPQTVRHHPDGRFQLFRVGDAVASRNIHSAIYDSLRLCKDL